MESKGGSYLQGTGAWLWHSQQSPEPRDRRSDEMHLGFKPLLGCHPSGQPSEALLT